MRKCHPILGSFPLRPVLVLIVPTLSLSTSTMQHAKLALPTAAMAWGNPGCFPSADQPAALMLAATGACLAAKADTLTCAVSMEPTVKTQIRKQAVKRLFSSRVSSFMMVLRV
jgi:hypothetical protein